MLLSLINKAFAELTIDIKNARTGGCGLSETRIEEN